MSHKHKKTTLWIGTTAILGASMGVVSTAHSEAVQFSQTQMESPTNGARSKAPPGLTNFPDSVFGKGSQSGSRKVPDSTFDKGGRPGSRNFPDSTFDKGGRSGKSEFVTDPENMSPGGARFPDANFSAGGKIPGAF